MRDVSNIIYIHLILPFKFDHFLDCIKLNLTNSKWGNGMHSDKALLNQKQYKINGMIQITNLVHNPLFHQLIQVSVLSIVIQTCQMFCLFCLVHTKYIFKIQTCIYMFEVLRTILQSAIIQTKCHHSSIFVSQTCYIYVLCFLDEYESKIN